MFGVVCTDAAEARAVLGRVRAQADRPLEATVVEAPGVSFGVLTDAGPDGREGVYRAAESGNCAALAGNITRGSEALVWEGQKAVLLRAKYGKGAVLMSAVPGVYHLGFEVYGDGGEIIDAGIVLHRYYRRAKPSKRED